MPSFVCWKVKRKQITPEAYFPQYITLNLILEKNGRGLISHMDMLNLIALYTETNLFPEPLGHQVLTSEASAYTGQLILLGP